jgi:hypothetical protein
MVRCDGLLLCGMKGGYTFSLPTTSAQRLCYDAPLLWTFGFVFLLQTRT